MSLHAEHRNVSAAKVKPVTIDHMRISVSYYCNLHCEHCYVPEEFRDEYKSLLEPKQLSVEEMQRFVTDLIEWHGLKKLSITGGEPLLKKVWPRSAALLRIADEFDLNVQLNTGGLGQVPIRDVVGMCSNPKRLMFQFSFDGANAETVDGFRRKKGVFDSARGQMADAVAEGALVQARFTANRHNIDQALAAYAMVSEIGIDSFKIKPMIAAGVAVDNKDALLNSADEVRDLQEKLIAASAGRKTRLELAPPVFVDPGKFAGANVVFAGCNCGSTSGYLSTSGDLFPCSYAIGDAESSEFLVGNIRNPGFDLDTEWRNSPALAAYKANSGCAQCPTQDAMMRNLENRGLACV